MEYKVKLRYQEDDSYNELWQIVGTKKYVARHTHGGGIWYHVCDPLGYRELDYPFRDDDIFIVCDQKGKELFRTSNGDGTSRFNTIEQEGREQWSKYFSNLPHSFKPSNPHAEFMAHWATGVPQGKLNKWLLSFKDPDIYPEAKDYDDNWVYFMIEKDDKPETLYEFQWLGETWKIEKVHCKHKICGVEWDEYYSADYFMGSDFDETNIGTMYSETEARKILSEAIKANWPDTGIVSYVNEVRNGKECYYREHRVRVEYAWDVLNGGDIHRKVVDQAAAAEREKTRFYHSLREIREQYPDCVPDTTFRYY